jgi:coenzyme F420-reducing hydrogenase beta subunit
MNMTDSGVLVDSAGQRQGQLIISMEESQSSSEDQLMYHATELISEGSKACQVCTLFCSLCSRISCLE